MKPTVLLTAELPGPDRSRRRVNYDYRPMADDVWIVRGGREEYQVALERDAIGGPRWHCTCADAVYRRRLCKHVVGLLAFGCPVMAPAA